MFPGVEEQLVAALRASTDREVYVYRGNETVAQTVGVFANARAVVGYHGAGFANTMLSAHGACVLEISTNTDTADENRWRTNAFMCLPWNPSLRWAVYRVPLTQMLDANSIKYATQPSLLRTSLLLLVYYSLVYYLPTAAPSACPTAPQPHCLLHQLTY